MRWLAALLLMLPGLAVAGDAPPWVGVWTAEPDWCEFADRIGRHDPAPV